MSGWLSRRRAERDDAGLGMLLVIGLVTVLSLLATVTLAAAVNALSSSRSHVRYEQALSAAESGIDFGLARLQKASDDAVGDYPIPAPAASLPGTACDAPTVDTGAPAGFATVEAERSWARGALLALAAARPECIRDGGTGQYLALKPTDRKTVYSMGWEPSYANPLKQRLLKAEYVFGPYKPGAAILVSGNLVLDASTSVQSAGSYAPDLASVHANGTVSVGGGNPSVTGPVSCSSPCTASSNNFTANPGGVATVGPKKYIPPVRARSVYNNYASSFSNTQWYDLCPGGLVKQPSTAPCASTAAPWVDLAPGQSIYGWTYTVVNGVDTWLAGKNIPSAVWYVYQGNVAPASGAGNTSIANATILAEAVNPTSCNKVGGSINWDHNDIAAPMIEGTFMVADTDLQTSSNFTAGSINGSTVVGGMFIAGDQVNMQTSSNGAVGSVLAADQCADPTVDGWTNLVTYNWIKNPTVYFDPEAYSPITAMANTTLWLEYVG